MSWATTVASRAKLKAALQQRDYLKVLDLAEDVFARNPWDRDARASLAKAAEELGYLKVALWAIREVWEADRKNANANRGLARLYEKKGDLSRAIEFWTNVTKLDPSDFNAPRQVKDLSARQTLAR